MTAIPCEDITDRLLSQRLEEAPRERRTRLFTHEDDLARYAEESGVARLYEMETGGRIYAEYGPAYGRAKIMYASREEAENAFSGLRKGMAEKLRLQAKAMKAGADLTLDKPVRGVEWTDLDPTNPYYLDQVAHGEVHAPLNDAGAYTTGKLWLKLGDLAIPRKTLEAIGPAGRWFSQQVERFYALYEKAQAQSMMLIERAHNGLDPEEIATGLARHAERGDVARAEVTAAYQELLAHKTEKMRTANAIGLETAPMIKNYFPHVRNQQNLSDGDYIAGLRQQLAEQGLSATAIEEKLSHAALGVGRDAAIENIMRRHATAGHPLNRSEAEYILDQHIMPNAVFRSGHLESERTSGLPYIEDSRIAWATAFARDNRRLAQAQVFGPRYELGYAMLDSIRQDGGEAAYQMAQKVFNLTVGREQSRLPDWLSTLYNFQNAKLSLSVISNLTQVPLNVPIRVGVGNTLRGFLDFLTQDKPLSAIVGYDTKLMSQHAREAGAIVTSMQDAMRADGMMGIFGQEGAKTLFGKFTNTVVDWSTRLFNFVETANRSVATRAGEHYFDQQVERLLANPEDLTALRRLREFFPSRQAITAIVERARNGDDGMLAEFRSMVGKHISDETQFKTTSVSRPLFFNSPSGRILGQFKQFTLQQMEFMSREMMAYKHADDPARTIRMIALAATAFPAIAVGSVQLKKLFMGESLTSQQIDEALRDPTIGNLLAAGVTAMLTTGTMGIMGDAIGTAMTGNRFALQTFLQPPAVSSALNVLEAGSSVLKAAGMGATGQPGSYDEIESGIRALSREFGGYGAIVTRQAEKQGLMTPRESR